MPLSRPLLALAVVLAYGVLCAACLLRQQRRERRAHAASDAKGFPGEADQAPVWVAHASQTGFARQLAEETAQALQRAGLPVRLLSLGALGPAQLTALAGAGSPLLMLASTCGEGDGPDEAAKFAAVMAAEPGPDLADLRYGLLALGDNSYANFCGFGRRLRQWLEERGARTLFEPVEVDNGDEAAIETWQHRVGALVGHAQAFAAREDFRAWRLVASEKVAGEDGPEGADPLVRLDLAPADGQFPDWQAGDLALVRPPEDGGADRQPRAYSIATLPAEGRLSLLVRERRDAAGRPGRVSGWLAAAAPGDTVALRLRAHPNFRLGDNAARPLILIGAGTGMAGLRALLAARIADGEGRNWLIFGERREARDFHYGAEIRRWHGQGLIRRLDLAFSRDGAERIYVQHRLVTAEAELKDWLAEGAAIYLCGSAVTLAPAIDQVLADAIGEAGLAELLASGRYRRDVY